MYPPYAQKLLPCDRICIKFGIVIVAADVINCDIFLAIG